VGRAGLTKGALYHHFSSKAALFEALYVEMASEVAVRVTAALAIRRRDAWDRMLAAIAAFFDASAEPDYVRIVLQDAPTVLGAQRGRELDHAIGLSLIVHLLQDMAGEGRLPPLPIEVTARILLAAVSEIAIAMACSDYPGQVRSEGEGVIVALLEGLMAKAEPG
jgi:AcrR family transcriptional regulator